MSTLEWLRGLAPGADAVRIDHPMASLEEAKALLAQLPAGNPERCLAEAANWLSSVAVTEGFAPALRMKIVGLIEDRAAPCGAELVSETFAAAGGATEAYAAVDAKQPAAEADPAKLRTLFDFCVALADAQRACLAPAPTAEADAEARGMLVRNAHALARRMVLRRMLRLPADAEDWAQLDACYSRAAAMKSTRTAQAIGGADGKGGIGRKGARGGKAGKSGKAGKAGTADKADNAGLVTSVLREYLRAVLFELGAPESLNPRATELLYRIAGRQAPVAQLVTERSPGAKFAAFPGKGIGPRPVARVSAGSTSARFLDLTLCAEQLRAFAADPAGGVVQPADRALTAEFGVAERNAVIAHAISHWGASPPHRVESRLALSGSGRIVGGFAGALGVVTPAAQGEWLLDLASLGPLAGAELANDPDATAQREQTPVRVLDASVRGLGVLVPRQKCAWVRVGSLLAVHVDSAVGWALAIVRRVGASGDDLRLGLQILAPHPRALWLRVPESDSERIWARSKQPIDVAAGLVRALQPAADPRGLVPGQLLLDPGIAATAETFEVPLPDRLQCIRIVKRLSGTAEFARVAFVLAEARALPRWALARAAKPVR